MAEIWKNKSSFNVHARGELNNELIFSGLPLHCVFSDTANAFLPSSSVPCWLRSVCLLTAKGCSLQVNMITTTFWWLKIQKFHLFKGWAALSIEWITINCITQLILMALTFWMVIYPVESAIHPGAWCVLFHSKLALFIFRF